MVIWSNILYFMLLAIFMNGLFLDNDFWIRSPYIIISIAVAVVSLVLLFLVLSFYYYFIFLNIIFDIIIIMYWGGSWGSRDVFQPKMPYYAKMGACLMKNSGLTFTFIWKLESLCIHNLAYTTQLVGHGQGLVHSTCLTWDFLDTYRMFFNDPLSVCTTQVTNYGNQ